MSESTALEALLEFLNAAEAGIAAAKRLICQAKGVVAVSEKAFNILRFERQTGARIGEFEVAKKANNLGDEWNHAYQILRRNNATINSRYHGDGYAYAYWLYGQERIYRQRLKS